MPIKKVVPDKNKLKRMRVEKRIDRHLGLSGPVHKVLENITKMHMEAALKGWKDIKIVHVGDYDDSWYELHGTRMETDAEMKHRFARIRREKASAAEKKAVEELKKKRRQST